MEQIKQILKKYFKGGLPGNNPDFLIIGSQKSGTSSLHFYLNQFPNFSGSRSKELHYFDRLINHGYSLRWYKSHFFKLSFQKPLYFETTPAYIYHESVAKRVSELFPDIKLILILREPISRAFSAFNMYKRIVETGKLSSITREVFPGEMNPIYKAFVHNRKSFPSFREAIDIELDLIRENGNMEPALLRRGLYADQIKNWSKYFDKSQLLILGFNDLSQNLPNTLFDISKFLNVQLPPIESINKEVKNSGTYFSTLQEEDKRFLESFYANPNTELFDLLGKVPNW